MAMKTYFDPLYCGLKLEHPVCAAEGWCKTVDEIKELVRSASSLTGVGSVILTPDGRSGNRGQTYWSNGSTKAFNALGIPCPSEGYYREKLPLMVRIAHDAGKPLVFNIAGFSPEDYVRGAELAVKSGVDVVIVNAGCPNLWNSGIQKPIISHDPESLFEILDALGDAIGRSEIPIDVKISPIESLEERRGNLLALWKVFRAFPMIKAVTAINTVPNKVGRDESGAQCIQSPDVPMGMGGMSGAIIKPLGLWYVGELARLARGTDITIRACGGVTRGQDVADYLGVGEGKVSAVQVGDAVHYLGLKVLSEILREYSDLQEEE